MAKIFEREEAERALPLVRLVVGDLSGCLAELREVSERDDAGGEPAALRAREIRAEIERHVRELESIGCCVRTPSDPVVKFPAVRGHRFGFYEFRWQTGELSDWTPSHASAVERDMSSPRRARRGTP